MKVQFLSDGSDFRPRGGGGQMARGRRDESLFWWTILITLLLGLATFCWFFSIMVFKYPEKPFNYRLLSQLEKLEPIEKFDPLSVPHGAFHGPRELLARYYSYNPEQLRMVNDLLKRSYITNYAKESPVYVRGTYVVESTRPLTESDVIASGWVVRARSVDLEDVEIELILPGAKTPEAPYAEGESVTLDNKSSFGSVVNIDRSSGNDGICASLVPISYGAFTGGTQKTVQISPPAALNMEAAWPLTEGQENATAVKVAAKSGL